MGFNTRYGQAMKIFTNSNTFGKLNLKSWGWKSYETLVITTSISKSKPNSKLHQQLWRCGCLWTTCKYFEHKNFINPILSCSAYFTAFLKNWWYKRSKGGQSMFELEMGPDPTRAYFWPAVNKRQAHIWPRYFLTRPDVIFLTLKEKYWKILKNFGFWGKFSKPKAKPKMADQQKIGSRSKIFDPDPSLVRIQITDTRRLRPIYFWHDAGYLVKWQC